MLSLKNNGNYLISEKIYTGKAILETNWAARAQSYQKVLEMAMNEMLQQLMPDILMAIKS